MICKAFAGYNISPQAAGNVLKARLAFSDLAALIEEVAPPSRERSIAMTEIESAAHWVVKAITHNHPDSVQQA